MEVHNFSTSPLALSEVHRGSFSPAPSASVSVPSISHCLCPFLRWRDLSPSLTALASVCQLAPSLFLSHCLFLSVSLTLSPSLTLHEILPSSAQGSPETCGPPSGPSRQVGAGRGPGESPGGKSGHSCHFSGIVHGPSLLPAPSRATSLDLTGVCHLRERQKERVTETDRQA